MATYSVTQSGQTIQIESDLAGFTKDTENRYYTATGSVGERTQRVTFTLGDGRSFYLTDFNELSFGSSDIKNAFGILGTANPGYTASINFITGYGYNTTFDLYDGESNTLLLDDFRATSSGDNFQPLVVFDYTSSSGLLKVSTPRGSSFSIDSLGAIVGTITSTTGGTDSSTPQDFTLTGGINIIEGTDRRDTLVGTNGIDHISAKRKADKLTGGLSGDRLTGGKGHDRFIYLGITDSTPDAPDTITDFANKRDKLDLRQIDANSSTDGDQKFSFIKGNSFSGVAGQLRFSVGRLEADVNGDSVADFVVLLDGVSKLSASSILL